MQHRLNLCIKTRQNVHPRTLVAFVIETLSAVIQYYPTIGNIWDSLYAKHQIRDSDITLDRVYTMLSEFLIELKLNEEHEKITQIVTGSNQCSNKADQHTTSMSTPARARSRKRVKAKEEKERMVSRHWRQPCNDYWRARWISNTDTTARSIIPDDNNQDDVRYGTGEKSQQGLIVYHGITSNQKKGGNLVQWRSSRQDLTPSPLVKQN